jgi:hypothetical protein
VLKTHPGIGWISALRSEKVRKLVDEKHLQLSLFDERNLAEIGSAHFPDERLVACFNPLLAEERRRKRNELLDATEKLLEKVCSEVQRRTKTPLSAAQIGQKVGKVINRHKVGKHFAVSIAEGRFSFSRRTEAITRESELDGLYVIRTSEPEQDLSANDTVRSYKNLGRWSEPFAPSKAWICAFARFTIAARSVCVPTSSRRIAPRWAGEAWARRAPPDPLPPAPQRGKPMREGTGAHGAPGGKAAFAARWRRGRAVGKEGRGGLPGRAGPVEVAALAAAGHDVGGQVGFLALVFTGHVRLLSLGCRRLMTIFRRRAADGACVQDQHRPARALPQIRQCWRGPRADTKKVRLGADKKNRWEQKDHSPTHVLNSIYQRAKQYLWR